MNDRSLSELDVRVSPFEHSISLVDIRRPDMPLVYVNRGFEAMTGYAINEAIGQNCRILQGPQTDAGTVKAISAAIAGGEPLITDILNYRKDGTSFWNRLSLRPVRDPAGEVSHYVGIQSDISRLLELEERVSMFARALAGHPAPKA